MKSFLGLSVYLVLVLLMVSPVSIIVQAKPETGWSVTDNLNNARSRHTATLLKNGTVLVAGGTTDSCEIYNPSTGTWTNTGSMNTSREFSTAILLPDGRVLVTGGRNQASGILSSCELYNPKTDKWSYTGSLNVPRWCCSSILLNNGKVLVTGGNNTAGVYDSLKSCEIYNPGTGTWATAGGMNVSRKWHVATLLRDGKVLVTGGINTDKSLGKYEAEPSCELYDPVKDSWTVTGSLTQARYYHIATLMNNGKVLVAGGRSGLDYTESPALSSGELYDPRSGIWSPTPGLSTGHGSHTATLLRGGQVLLVDGFWTYSGAVNVITTTVCEMYNPVTNIWSATVGNSYGRANFTATLLRNGRILITGGWGYDADGYGTNLNSCELYTP